jgi:peptidoglycan hydrolase-like protein with peptidoglycan-binding domain
MATITATEFPGRVIRRGERDPAVVRAIQSALDLAGYGPFRDGVFDDLMEAAVRRFQAQHVDASGHALRIDGEVGRFTWGALLAQPVPTPSSAPSTLMLQSLAIAGSQVGQMEVPPLSNRGPQVDEYLRSVGIDPERSNSDGRNWCMAFVYWSFKTAALSLGGDTPLPKSAGCLDHWNLAARVQGARRIARAEAYADASLVKPGLVFILDLGQGHGHTGIVERAMAGGRLVTIEGNTNNDGSRTGVGVFRLDRRKLSDKVLKGFIDYSAAGLVAPAPSASGVRATATRPSNPPASRARPRAARARSVRSRT